MKRGLTLIEILVVMAILAVLAAILTPVLTRAKLESKASAAKLNLKGFWHGLVLYQAEYDQKVDYGSAEDMGLPHPHYGWVNFVAEYTKDTRETWRTKSQFLPCGIIESGSFKGMGLFYMPNVLMDWPNDVVNLQEDTVLLTDPTCNSGSPDPVSSKENKRAIGITLGGQIKDRARVEWPLIDQRFYR